MKIRSLMYHFKDGFKNIHRNRMFSLASIATITACIFIFGVIYSLFQNFEFMVKKAENEICVTVFFDEGLSDAQIKQIGDTISKREEVSSMHFTTAEEAWNNFKSEYFADFPELAEGFRMIIHLRTQLLMRFTSTKPVSRMHLLVLLRVFQASDRLIVQRLLPADLRVLQDLSVM